MPGRGCPIRPAVPGRADAEARHRLRAPDSMQRLAASIQRELHLHPCTGRMSRSADGAAAPSKAARSTHSNTLRRSDSARVCGTRHASNVQRESTSSSACTSAAHAAGLSVSCSRTSNTSSKLRRNTPRGCERPSSAFISDATVHSSVHSSVVAAAAMIALCCSTR